MANNILRVVPLGGLGEIGKNMLALEYENDIVVIDAGILFPKEDMPGVDFVIPDISYLIERKHKVRAILITHGHEDHIGALPYVLPHLDVPVYAPPLAHGLITVKLKERRLLRGRRVLPIEPGKKLKLGRFRAEFFRVCHSIPDAMGIALETPLGLVIHSGDFKIDHTPADGTPTDLPKLAALASQGVFLLFSDSTYAELPGYTASEQVVGEALDRAIGEAPGRVMIATFASLISRIQQVINAAAKYDRKVAIVGRSMVDNVGMALKMGYLTAPPEVLISVDQMQNYASDQLVLMATGSQGEPTSVLVRIANGDHRQIAVEPGDTFVISATPIPGNENVVSRTIDNLFRQGARVLYHRNATVHVHGHASQEELKTILNITRPRFFVPVHGEYRHLVAHANLAQAIGIPKPNTFVLESGDILEVNSNKGEVTEKVNGTRIYVDGLGRWGSNNTILRDRKLLSRDGFVVIVLRLNKATKEIIGHPKVISSGFIEDGRSPEIFRPLVDLVSTALDCDGSDRGEWINVSAKVKETVGKYLYKETGRRPMIIPVTIDD